MKKNDMINTMEK